MEQGWLLKGQVLGQGHQQYNLRTWDRGRLASPHVIRDCGACVTVPPAHMCGEGLVLGPAVRDVKHLHEQRGRGHLGENGSCLS